MSYGSSWTRGQGWALYGFTLSYLHTKKERYLETAERVADYFISCIPESGLIPVDFYQDPSCDWRDDTAGNKELEEAEVHGCSNQTSEGN